MPFKSGQWGIQEKERSRKRLQYFRQAANGFRKENHLKLVGESIAKKLLKTAIYVDQPSHDFELDGLKIEVKSANRHKNGRWYFSITNELQVNSDYFLLVFLENGKFIEAQLVPTNEITVKKTLNCTLNRFANFKLLKEVIHDVGRRRKETKKSK